MKRNKFDETQLIFIAKVLDSKEIEDLDAEKKIDNLEEKLEWIK